MDSPPPLVLTPQSLRSEACFRSKPSSAICLAGSVDAAANGTHHDSTPPPRKSCSAAISSSENHVPLRELLLLSSSPPARRHRSRIHVHADAENVDPDAATPRKRWKNHRSPAAAAGNAGFGMSCSSPRNTRRPRRRLEREILTREEREPVALYEEDAGRTRRLSRPSKTAVSSRKEMPVERSLSGQPLLSPVPSERGSVGNEDEQVGLEGVCELVSELVMWKDTAKSSLWFGFGTLCFASYSFSRNNNFNFISAVSHLGLLMLALAFFCDTFSHRFEEKRWRELRLKEDDFLKVIRLALPAANAVIRTVQEVFSGEPSMTLKVAPVLFFATKYGHMITVWRLLAAGFLLSFTVPKIYSSYNHQIHVLAESSISRISEAWRACRHKRAAALAAGVIFWNLLSVKTRVFAAFFAVVMLRYRRQQLVSEEGGTTQDEAVAEEENTKQRGQNEVEETFGVAMDLAAA